METSLGSSKRCRTFFSKFLPCVFAMWLCHSSHQEDESVLFPFRSRKVSWLALTNQRQHKRHWASFRVGLKRYYSFHFCSLGKLPWQSCKEVRRAYWRMTGHMEENHNTQYLASTNFQTHEWSHLRPSAPADPVKWIRVHEWSQVKTAVEPPSQARKHRNNLCCFKSLTFEVVYDSAKGNKQ